MFKGSSNLNLDSKGRMTVPSKYRASLLAESEGGLVATISPTDRCLWLYSQKTWSAVEEKMVALSSLYPSSRKLKRVFFAYADDSIMDANGRLLIASTLREYANLKKEIYLIGQGDKFEIWNAPDWISHRDNDLLDALDETLLAEISQPLPF